MAYLAPLPTATRNEIFSSPTPFDILMTVFFSPLYREYCWELPIRYLLKALIDLIESIKFQSIWGESEGDRERAEAAPWQLSNHSTAAASNPSRTHFKRASIEASWGLYAFEERLDRLLFFTFTFICFRNCGVGKEKWVLKSQTRTEPFLFAYSLALSVLHSRSTTTRWSSYWTTSFESLVLRM